jgi:UDP-3-O-[3-hydroxymyristoyl] glucosamine N-acyltransferase
MKRLAYMYYTTLFGHTKSINKFVNAFSDHTIRMGNSVKTGRKTRISGDVDIESNVSIGSDCIVRGNIDIGTDVSIRSNCHIRGDVDILIDTNT